MGKLRIYCSRKCTAEHGEELKRQRNEDLPPRRCECGSTDVARVGKPVCPACRKDQRGTEKLQARERRRTLALYGLTEEQWDRLVAYQGNRCAICPTTTPGGRGESWHIDHDAATGVVRGLLCHGCNTGIGNLRHDPKILMAAVEYLASPPAVVALMADQS
jgi:hypothetical protein